MRNNIIIFNNDMQKYPPLISIVNILLSNQEKVIYLGYCGSKDIIQNFSEKGMIYNEINVDKNYSNKLKKLYIMYKYRRNVKCTLNKISNEKSILWIFGNDNIWILNSLIAKYKTILYLFEIPKLKVDTKYRLISPLFNYKKTMQQGWKVICAEFNRAHITKNYFNLKELPKVIPNKTSLPELSELKNLDINTIQNITTKLKGKKVILYQGIFNYPERKLDEICQAMEYLPDYYSLVLMGPDSKYKEYLNKKYKSNKIIILPFLPPPIHLKIAELADIGVLSYFPADTNISSILNVLYCAPNKIFEFSRFGIPMISNNVPALHYIFSKFNAGICSEPFSPQHIANDILKIEKNYNEYQKGSINLFNSVKIEPLILNLIDFD